MKITLILVGGLVGLVVIVLVVGALLPRRHSASVAARYRQTPEAVFASLVGWRDFASWRSGMKRVEERASATGAESWVEVTSFGPMPLEVLSSDPPRELVLKIASDELPFGGTWTYVVEPADGGARLTITEDGEVKNALFRFMSRFVFGHHKTMETYLTDLGRKFGEEVETERVAD